MLDLANILELPSVPLSEKYKLPSEQYGIYFVIQKETLIYIGITVKNFKERWRTHHRYYWFLKKDSESPVRIYFQSLQSPLEELLKVEKEYQNYFELNTRKPCKPDSEKVLELTVSKTSKGYRLLWSNSDSNSEESFESLTMSKLIDLFKRFISELLDGQLNEKIIELNKR